MSEFMEAAKQGDIKQLAYYLDECKLNVNITYGEDRYFALYWAACNGHSAAVFYLINKYDTNVNQTVKWGSSALHAAAERGHQDCVLHLCQGNASINCQNANMETPLHLACYRGHLEVCKILLTFRANVTLLNKESKTCFDEAYSQRNLFIYEYLVRYVRGSLENRKDMQMYSLYRKSNDRLKAVKHKTFVPGTAIKNSTDKITSFNQNPKRLFNQQTCVTTDKTPSETLDTIYPIRQTFTQSNKEVNTTEVVYQKDKLLQHNKFPLDINLNKITGINVLKENTPKCFDDLSTIKQVKEACICSKLTQLPHPLCMSQTHITNESLHAHIVKVKDQIRYLEKVNQDLYSENEKLKTKYLDQQSKIALHVNYKRKYEHLLEEYELISKRLKESENRSRSLAVLVAKYQNYNSTQTIDTNQKVTVAPARGIDRMEKPPTGEALSHGKRGKTSSSSSNSSEGSSLDSFTSNILHNTDQNTSHYELYKSLLPAFRYMGRTFHKTVAKSLKNSLEKSVYKPETKSLDAPGTEWVCGEHFTLASEEPINRQSGSGHNAGSSSLIFRILNQDGKVYILKMMINLVNMAETKHGSGQSYPLYLYQQFSPEHDIPALLPPHANIVPVLHYFNGTTIPFQKYLTYCYPPELQTKHAPVEMAGETTYIIMPEYPTTLAQLFERTYKLSFIDEFGKCGTLPETFILQKLFEVLLAVSFLKSHKIVHRDIKADNIFLDHDLRAIVGDFGFSRRVQTIDGEDIPFVERNQAIAGSSSAWSKELIAYNKTGPEHLDRKLNLEEIYETTDTYAVGTMFYNLLTNRMEVESIPENYTKRLSSIINGLRHEDTSSRLPGRQALILTGLLLFGFSDDEVHNEEECQVWHHAKRMKLLIQKPLFPRSPGEDVAVLSVEASVQRNIELIERQFLFTSTIEEIWQQHLFLQTIC